MVMETFMVLLVHNQPFVFHIINIIRPTMMHKTIGHNARSNVYCSIQKSDPKNHISFSRNPSSKSYR